METALRERLQKIIASAGIASRREAERLILAGRVTVNGQVMTELGSKADVATDYIKVDGKRLPPTEAFAYFILNKPYGVLSTVSDPEGRPVVTDFVRSSARLYPAGRLDFDSEGLVILTNDGELTHSLTEAGKVPKVYRVKVRGKPSEEILNRLRDGIRLEDGTDLAPCLIKFLKVDRNCWLEVVLRQGRNRQIRSMFEFAGHPVMRLKRTAIGPIRLGLLRLGTSRKLKPAEVERLKEYVSKKGRAKTSDASSKGPRQRKTRSLKQG